MTDTITFDVHEPKGFTEEELIKYFDALAITSKVISTERFKQKFLAEKLTSTQKHTNLAIYEMFMSGIDEMNKAADKDIDVFPKMYYKNNSVIGFTNPLTVTTNINRKFFTDYDAADIGHNAVHEYLHKMGFDHNSASDHDSVPYAIGFLVETCIREYWLHPELYNDIVVTEPPVVVTPVEPIPVKLEYVCYRSWKTLWLKKVCYWKKI
jgi:ssRNA-specific RNase YbeY (16S rRNA maturation enzyme)